MISAKASTIVVIKGLATTAGSSLHFLASIGSKHPTSFAITIVINKTKETINATFMLTSLYRLSIK